MSDIAENILTLEEAVKWRKAMKEKGLSVAVTNGCFDLLHRGHAVYLDAARKEADALLVLVNSDSSVRALKGPERPLQNEDDRAFLLYLLVPAGSVYCRQVPAQRRRSDPGGVPSGGVGCGRTG